MGTIPYGYEITDDFSFVIVEDEARIVAEIIANIAAGSTLYAEAKRLNDLGIPSPGHRYRSKPRKYGPSWWHSTVRGIVQQRAYAGTHEVKINGSSERIERKVPATVEPALQERALLSIAENKRFSGGKGQQRDYLLRGFVWCAECGAAYVGSGARGYHYYSCSRRNHRYDGRTNKLS